LRRVNEPFVGAPVTSVPVKRPYRTGSIHPTLSQPCARGGGPFFRAVSAIPSTQTGGRLLARENCYTPQLSACGPGASETVLGTLLPFPLTSKTVQSAEMMSVKAPVVASMLYTEMLFKPPIPHERALKQTFPKDGWQSVQRWIPYLLFLRTSRRRSWCQSCTRRRHWSSSRRQTCPKDESH